MRRRSYTIEADSVEELTEKAVHILKSPPIQLPQKQASLVHLKSYRATSPSRSSSKLSNLSLRTRSYSTNPTTEDFWSDFDFKGDEKDVKTLDDDDDKDTNDQTMLSSYTESKSKSSLKCMVMGSSGSGRHEIVNSMFESEETTKLEQAMDLVLKFEEEDDNENVYQFWIRSLNDNKYDSLVKMYYKNMSVFMFVYAINDSKSFEMLAEGIDQVLKEVNRDKFMGILIGTWSSKDDKREVSYEDGEYLKEKYKLSFFLEANPSENTLKDSLGKFMQSKIKQEKSQ